MSGDSTTTKAQPRSYAITSWLFLRALGFIYLIAFLSLAAQWQGLIGSDGILPAQQFLTSAKVSLGANGFWQIPTIAWLDSSDRFLAMIPIVGSIASLFVILGLFTAPALIVCWFFYLSLMTIGGDFLMFQWDSLLTETGFLAIFLAPWRLAETPWRLFGKDAQTYQPYQPPQLIIFLLRLLLFRLLFGSGLCKLQSGDPAWRDLTALTYHYWSQPLPTPLAWWMDKLPLEFQKLSCAFVFFQEIFIPVFVFFPRTIRFVAGAFMLGLQLIIIATGNYAFFNILTIALILMLYDDDVWKKLFPPSLWQQLKASTPAQNPSLIHKFAGRTCFAFIVAIFVSNAICDACTRSNDAPQFLYPPASMLVSFTQPFNIFNRYGLFAIMTTSRLEIQIEGSNDGNVWQAYEFKYKPGPLDRPPPIVAPYQPRLDWQMWFASLSDYQSNRWFVNLMRRLLDGSPSVLALFEKNPFPDKPPHYIRALVYDYRFTSTKEKSGTGVWWRRTAKGVYFPVATLGNN